jgi:hypothetical protein
MFSFYSVPNVPFSLGCGTLGIIGYGSEWSETLLLSTSQTSAGSQDLRRSRSSLISPAIYILPLGEDFVFLNSDKPHPLLYHLEKCLKGSLNYEVKDKTQNVKPRYLYRKPLPDFNCR